MKRILIACVALLGLGLSSCIFVKTEKSATGTTNAALTCDDCAMTMATAASTKTIGGKTRVFCCGKCEANYTKTHPN